MEGCVFSEIGLSIKVLHRRLCVTRNPGKPALQQPRQKNKDLREATFRKQTAEAELATAVIMLMPLHFY